MMGFGKLLSHKSRTEYEIQIQTSFLLVKSGLRMLMLQIMALMLQIMLLKMLQICQRQRKDEKICKTN